MERQYKDSGIDWVKRIPKEWEVGRFKNIFKTGKGLNFTKGDLIPEGIPVVSYGQVHSKKNTGTKLDDELIRHIPSELIKGGEASKVNVGDFIFADTSEDIEGCGNAVYVNKEIGLYAGYHSVIAKAKYPEQSKYFAYLFLTECWRSQIRKRVTGIKVFSISQGILNETTIILPTLSEQIIIGNYLDEKCGIIDSLIELQEQMIEKLKAYKQSVITEAVTKGLNPNAKLVPSGIDWIGDIPEHWEVSRLKYFSIFINGFAFNSDVFTLDKGCKVIRIGDISQSLDFEGCVKANIKTDALQSYRIKNNDIVIAMSGATTGKCCIAKEVEEAYINQRVGIIRCDNYSYVYYSLQTDYFMEYINLNNAGSAQPNVSGTSIGNFPLLVPPLSEQQYISSYLDDKCSEIDKLIAVKQQKIEKLKGYKKSVIYEAVTGKIIIE